MSYVPRISGSTPITPPNRTNPSRGNSLADYPITFLETFRFPDKKLTIREEANGKLEPAKHPFYSILLALFLEVLKSGIDIVPTQPRDAGGYVLEAYFKPQESIATRSSLHLPLPIKALTKTPLKGSVSGKLSASSIQFVEEYVEKIIANFTSEQVLRLIVVAAHEFGHYQSFVRGNHDENLKRGLYIFHNKYTKSEKADEYTWLVFREECLAWHHAEVFLRKTSFDYWDTYEEVKNGSLKTYFDTLNLTNASLETYYKMSFLGEDFKKNSPSSLFTKEGSIGKQPALSKQASAAGG